MPQAVEYQSSLNVIPPAILPLLQGNTPYTPTSTYAQPVITLARDPLWRPTDIPNLVITRPTRSRSSFCACGCGADLLPMRSICCHQAPLTQKVPDQDKGVIATRRQCSSSRRRPFYAVDGCTVAFELQERLTRLPNVEDADAVAILGEGGEEVGVMWGGSETEERRGVGHGLLGCGWGEVSWTI